MSYTGCFRANAHPTRDQLERLRKAASTAAGRCPPQCSERLFPIRPNTVVAVNFALPTGIGHRRPVSLIESWSSLQALLGNVQNEALAIRIECQRTPRNGEELIADAKDAAERQDGISDAAA